MTRHYKVVTFITGTSRPHRRIRLYLQFPEVLLRFVYKHTIECHN